MNQDMVFNEIKVERESQRRRWAETDELNTVNDWVAYICRYAGKSMEFPQDHLDFRKRMVQVAAIAVAAVEACEARRFQQSKYV